MDHGCKEKFSGYAKCKIYSIMHVNVESSGCAGAYPQLHVDPPLLILHIGNGLGFTKYPQSDGNNTLF